MGNVEDKSNFFSFLSCASAADNNTIIIAIWLYALHSMFNSFYQNLGQNEMEQRVS